MTKIWVAGLFLSLMSWPSQAEVQNESNVIDQSGVDVQVLQAWTVREQVELDYLSCVSNSSERVTVEVRDCSQVAPIQGPTAAPWLATVEWQPYEERYLSRDYAGNSVEIRLVVRRSVLDSPSFRGVGFFASNVNFTGIHYTPSESLQFVHSEEVTLRRSGEKAAVLRFVMPFPGIQGHSATGWSMQSVEFKPFAQFETDGQTYRKWESAPSNYRLYRSAIGGGRPQVTSVNREDELLAK